MAFANMQVSELWPMGLLFTLCYRSINEITFITGILVIIGEIFFKYLESIISDERFQTRDSV